MNLILHILKKDLFRYRLLLALYFGLVIVHLIILQWIAFPPEALRKLHALISWFYVPSQGLFYVFPAILTCLVVHEEPLLGTTAFWQTRPVSRRQLLAAKALYVAILIAPSVIGLAALLSWDGVTLHDTIWASIESILELAWVLFLVMAMASLTQNLARFVIASVVLLVGYAFIEGIMAAIFTFAISGSITLEYSKLVIGMITVLLCSLAIITLQYFAVSFRTALALMVAGVLITSFLLVAWPIDFIKPPMAKPLGPILSFPPPALVGRFSVREGGETKSGDAAKVLNGNLSLPTETVMEVTGLNMVVTTDQGNEVPTQSYDEHEWALNYTSWSSKDFPLPISKALGNATLLVTPQPQRDNCFLMEVEKSVYWANCALPLHLKMKIKEHIYQFQNSVEVPVSEGSEKSFGSKKVKIVRVLQQPEGVELVLKVQHVDLLLAPTREDPSFEYAEKRYVTYVLWNKQRNEALIQTDGQNFDSPGGIFLVNDTRHILFPKVATVDEKWLSEATLVRLDLFPIADQTQTIEVPGFRMDGNFVRPQ